MARDMEQVLTEVARLEDALADIRYYADEMKAGDDGAGWGGLITSRAMQIEQFARHLSSLATR